MEDDNGLYTCIAGDPGGTTGWCVMATYPEVMGPPPFARWLSNAPVWGVEVARGTAGAEEAARLDWKQEVASAAGYRLLDNIVHFEVGQFTGDEDGQADAFMRLIAAWPASAVVVLESFRLRQFRSDEALLSPVRLNAIIQNRLRRLGLPGRLPHSVMRRPVYQTPSLALSSVTDERLQLWAKGRFFNATRGLPHGRDATRHALTFLRRERDARARGRSLEQSTGLD